MYTAVPGRARASVIAGMLIVDERDRSRSVRLADARWIEHFANPKSNTFTVPSGRTLILAGFKSR